MPDFQAYCGRGVPRFANDVELECAKLLDYYRVPWDYEPTTFVLERDEDGTRRRGVQARLLPPRAGSLPRVDGDEAVARDEKEPEAAQASAALPGHPDQALLQARHPAPGGAIQTRPRLVEPATPASGRSTSPRRRSARGWRSSGPRSPRDYEGREPVLVASLKTSIFFLADLSRAMPIAHAIDFIELAGYAGTDAAVRRAAPQGPRRHDRGPRRPARRGRRRHRPDPELRLPHASRCATRPRSPR